MVDIKKNVDAIEKVSDQDILGNVQIYINVLFILMTKAAMWAQSK